ncbi:MAG: Eco57I restriction-modification methylase domain-containing protein [Acidithiobacillus ferrivorans]
MATIVKQQPQLFFKFGLDFSPTAFCAIQETEYIKSSTSSQRKEEGQFFTPSRIALFMSQLAISEQRQFLKVVDPGGGVGMLSCAICEKAVLKNVKSIRINVYESSAELIPFLRQSLEYARSWLMKNKVELNYRIIQKEFITASVALPEESCDYDVAISNPPYFKISKNDYRAVAAKQYVFGQPNIYSLFMGAASELLKPGGTLVFITPRSFTAGEYFKAFRKTFFNVMTPEHLHLFESRKKAFKKHGVLQENLIIKAKKGGRLSKVEISTSLGENDIEDSTHFSTSLETVISKKNGDFAVKIPASEDDIVILDVINQWNENFSSLGYKISTGPVVPFRAEEYITSEKSEENKSPLLWMHNVAAMNVVWPCRNMNGKSKRQYIALNHKTKGHKLVLKERNMVLLRRFSSKEQHRRLTAAPLLRGQLDADYLGLENHLNFIYKKQGELSKEEAFGLSGLLDSSLVDRYFRIFSGSTQVNASEIKSIPMPPLKELLKLGKKLMKFKIAPSLHEIDEIVWEQFYKNN